MKELRYFECMFAKGTKENYTEDGFSICIIGYDEPTPEDATDFCSLDLKTFKYDFVSNVFEKTKDEAGEEFNLENEENFPVFIKTFEIKKDDISIDLNEIYVESNDDIYQKTWTNKENYHFEFQLTTWFDVDKKFYIDTLNNDDIWVNVFAFYDPIEDEFFMEYCIDSSDGQEYFNYIPTKTEKENIIYSLKETLETEDLIEYIKDFIKE